MILNKSSVERGMFHGQIYQVFLFLLKPLLDEQTPAIALPTSHLFSM